MDDNLISKEQWETVWSGVKIPITAKPTYDVYMNLKSYLPKKRDNYSLIEIGCAPGRWMAFFNKEFNYQVSGIEYARDAASVTIKNLNLQGIQAEVIIDDFLSWDSDKRRYEIVFSAGFIEHFQNLTYVVEKLCNLSSRYVVTMVPNLYGVNGFIRKKFSSKNFSEHIPIDVSTLESLHKRFKLKTLFCNYIGGVRFVPPGDGSQFYRNHRNCAKLIYIPVIMFNLLSTRFWRCLKMTPNSRLFSNSLMYIGEKNIADSNQE
ncbi:MAG: class I SAM-dependent methyltransferase [Syntrophaceae bacterium]|nr:class I SAM-dependent methyltransferase [Syntrophaceae bacterium]